MTYTRCPHCQALWFTEGECHACGFTGTCSICGDALEPDEEHAQFHSGACAAEAGDQARADAMRGDR